MMCAHSMEFHLPNSKNSLGIYICTKFSGREKVGRTYKRPAWLGGGHCYSQNVPPLPKYAIGRNVLFPSFSIPRKPLGGGGRFYFTTFAVCFPYSIFIEN